MFTHSHYPVDPRYPVGRIVYWPHIRILCGSIPRMTKFHGNRTLTAERRFSEHLYTVPYTRVCKAAKNPTGYLQYSSR